MLFEITFVNMHQKQTNKKGQSNSICIIYSKCSYKAVTPSGNLRDLIFPAEKHNLY